MSGTMSLTGTFDADDLPEVLGLLSRRGCTGRLQVRAGSRHAAIRLSDGNAVAVEGVAASSSESSGDLRACLEEVFFEALRSGRGSFEFHPEHGGAPRGQSRRTVRLATVVAAAQQRLEEWREVEAVIPSLEAVPRLGENLRTKEISLTQEQWKIVVSIDGRRTVSAIARRLGRKPVPLCKLLKPLVEGGAVGFEKTEAVAIRELPTVGAARGTPESEAAAIETASVPEATGQADGSQLSRRRARGPAFRVLARSGD